MPRGGERVTLPFYHRGGVRLLVALFYKNQNVPRKGWGVRGEGWGGVGWGGAVRIESRLYLFVI